MDRAARLLRGTLRVRVESAFPERVLNLCGAHGIAFSDLRWESVSALSFTVRAAERKKLERLLAPLDAALTVERAAGAPFFLRRFRRRYTLLAGLALMLTLVFANSFFIWDFEVSGSETVPAEKILRVLEKQGLRRGSFAYSFRPQLFPDGMTTDQPDRQVVGEIVREKLLRNLDKEIPHGTAVEITRFIERDDEVIEVDATIYCEKASHKGIIIGKNGAMLKKISTEARQDIERFMGTKVYLETWVKVKENWRDNMNYIRSFGYNDQ